MDYVFSLLAVMCAVCLVFVLVALAEKSGIIRDAPKAEKERGNILDIEV